MAKTSGSAGRKPEVRGTWQFEEELEAFQDRVRTELGLDKFEVSENDSTGYLVLDRIRVPPELRGQLRGDRAMRELTAFADRYGRTLELSPEPLDEASYTRGYIRNFKRLVAWYKEYGFRLNQGRYRDFSTRARMIRPPG